MATVIRLPHPESRRRPEAGLVRGILDSLRAGLRRDAAISALAGLDERLLRDIGLDPADVAALADARRPHLRGL